MKATVSIKHDGSLGNEVKIPFAIKTDIADVATIDVTATNGMIATQFNKYLVGDQVALVKDANSEDYYTSLKVDGVDVEIAKIRYYQHLLQKLKML